LDKEERDLRHVIYGINTAKGEPSGLWQDNGTGHGTHVAGIIGGRGPTRRRTPHVRSANGVLVGRARSLLSDDRG
jgi:subtilisin family serine protease